MDFHQTKSNGCNPSFQRTLYINNKKPPRWNIDILRRNLRINENREGRFLTVLYQYFHCLLRCVLTHLALTCMWSKESCRFCLTNDTFMYKVEVLSVSYMCADKVAYFYYLNVSLLITFSCCLLYTSPSPRDS